MKLKPRTIRDLAFMVTGGSGSLSHANPSEKWDAFPYRSSSDLTNFFIDCDLEHQHTGESRVPWTQKILTELNETNASLAHLPSDSLIRVIENLMGLDNFASRSGKDRNKCLELLNEVLSREGLEAYIDGAGICHIRAGQISSAGLDLEGRLWTQKDLDHKRRWKCYLESASEDEFTEKVLVPLLHQCGFRRINVAGHSDKALEYGKDLWMKYRLPTSHFIYFGVQVKKGKIDAAGKTKTDRENITEVLNQARMAMEHPIWDPEVNKRVLIDHVYIIASGEITKQAKQFLGERLDLEGRRKTIFMDYEDILMLVVQISMPLPSEMSSDTEVSF
jgi:hypothetical protein